MSKPRKDDGDNKTEVIVPNSQPDGKKTAGTNVIAPRNVPERKNTAGTDVVLARTPDPIVSRQRYDKPRTVGVVDNPHTPTNVNRYRHAGSPGHSVGQVRGMFVPWSREADFDHRDLPLEFPRQRLVPLSPGEHTIATRTMTRDLDLYEPPLYDTRNPLRDRYHYAPWNEHHPYDLPSGHYPYFSFPPDDENRYKRRVWLPPRERLVPKGRWSLATNASSRRAKPPGRGVISEPGKLETALWVNVHGEPTKPAHWPFRLRHSPELDRDFLESPLGKRQYIGHVPRVTDRDRWERQYWDYLVQMDRDSEVLDEPRRHRGYYKNEPAILETSNWIRNNYGILPDHTDHRDWFEREKKVYRQKERDRYFGGKEDYLLTRGSLLAMEGSLIGPDWYMNENQRRKILHDQDIARRRAYKDRVRHRDHQSDFTNVPQGQAAEKMERLRRGWWTPINVRDDDSRHTDYKPNWQVNNNWRHKKPRANPKYKNVSNWLHDQR